MCEDKPRSALTYPLGLMVGVVRLELKANELIRAFAAVDRHADVVAPDSAFHFSFYRDTAERLKIDAKPLSNK